MTETASDNDPDLPLSEDEFERRRAKEFDRRRKEMNARQWRLKINANYCEAVINYKPAACLGFLKQLFKAHYKSEPSEILAYAEKKGIPQDQAEAEVYEIKAQEFVREARHILYENLPRNLSKGFPSCIDDVLKALLPEALVNSQRRSQGLEPKNTGEMRAAYVIVASISRGGRSRGRPLKYSKTELERELRQAAKRVVKQECLLTFANVVEEINKHRRDKDPVTEDGIKKACKRYGVSWSNIKKAIINKGFRHFPRVKTVAMQQDGW
jgi:hypothetical protein